MSTGGWASACVALARPRISAMVAGAALFGFLLGWESGAPLGAGLAVCAGSFALCGGCSALNQVQERVLDARMRRTASRPVPAGRMSPSLATLWAVALMAVGLALYAAAGFLGAGPRGAGALVLAGVGVVALYNGLYTPLKRLTGLAVLVGGVPGAMPPYVGWLAAGGAPDAPGILAVCVVVYLWQVPHFWMLAELHHADYAAARLPLPPVRLPVAVYRPLMYLWVVAYFTTALTLPVFVGAPEAAPWMLGICAVTGAGVGLCGVWGRSRRAMAWLNASMPLLFAALLLGL